MYYFDSILFMGSGEHSAAKCHYLTCRLIQAFEKLSYMQQPMHWNREPTEEELLNEENNLRSKERELQQLAKDIAMALTGKKIEFK